MAVSFCFLSASARIAVLAERFICLIINVLFGMHRVFILQSSIMACLRARIKNASPAPQFGQKVTDLALLMLSAQSIAEFVDQ